MIFMQYQILNLFRFRKEIDLENYCKLFQLFMLRKPKWMVNVEKFHTALMKFEKFYKIKKLYLSNQFIYLNFFVTPTY